MFQHAAWALLNAEFSFRDPDTTHLPVLELVGIRAFSVGVVMTNAAVEHSSTRPSSISVGCIPRRGIAESYTVPDSSSFGCLHLPECKPGWLGKQNAC